MYYRSKEIGNGTVTGESRERYLSLPQKADLPSYALKNDVGFPGDVSLTVETNQFEPRNKQDKQTTSQKTVETPNQRLYRFNDTLRSSQLGKHYSRI